MLRTDLPSHRRSPEPQLLEALGRREALALAEACSRTLPVAFAVGRRLLPSTDVEALLLAVYEELWSSPPADVNLERWIRARTSALGLAELRAREEAPALPSVLAIAPDLPAPSLSYLDTTERTLAALDEAERRALLRAHDEGVPGTEQDEADAGDALARALRALADPDAPTAGEDGDGELADWVLGLVDPETAAALEGGLSSDQGRNGRVQVLRRGRRRIEGLPPTPDLGPRLLAAVLTSAPGVASEAPRTDDPPQTADDVVGDPGVEDDTGEIEVVQVAPAPAYRAAPQTETESETDEDGWGSVLGPLDEEDPTAAGDLVAPEVTGDESGGASALGPTAAIADTGGETEDLSSALREDPYADLRTEGDGPPARDAERKPYAALRERQDDPTSEPHPVGPDDPFADLREPREDGEEELDGRAGPSGLVRLLQIVGVLILIAGGIGLGLLLGQVIAGAGG